MRIIPHKCALYMYETIPVDNGRQVSPLLRVTVHVAVEGRRRETFSGFQGIQRGMFITLFYRHTTDHLFICHTTHFRGQTEFINLHIIIRVYFTFFECIKFRTQFFIKHALIT
jgi:hypothetical protein